MNADESVFEQTYRRYLSRIAKIADDEFKAQCSVLLRRSAERFLDMESVAMVGRVLSDLLLKQSPKEC